jgi:CheY-like chemotaxis protein
MKMSVPRIIVIEDNPADVRLLRSALDETGKKYELELLCDGEEALRFVRQCASSQGPDPCLIVIDLHLPRYDGAAILSAIRQEPALTHVRVAVLTTIASPQEELAIRSLGVDLYRNKPRELDGLKELAQEILRICNEEPLKIAAVN